MNAGKEKNRVQYFDIARGIAMICIILGHLNNSLINRVVFTFHVPIFFFISGYFMNSKCGIKDYARNKLRTLIVPYIVHIPQNLRIRSEGTERHSALN